VRRVRKVLETMGVLTGALFLAGIPAACGVSKSGIESNSGGNRGVGGSTQGHGGAADSGGAIGSGGATGGAAGSGGVVGTGGTAGSTTSTGTAGRKGAGGDGTGGMGTGGMGKGGTTGSGGSTIVSTGGMVKGGAGGMLKGGVDGGSVGGAGGMLRGGAGGAGGAPPLDGGSPDVEPPKCSEVTTQAACDARDDCHSVFEDPGTCGCASPGCCARFKSCAAGGYADCLGPAMCNTVQPFCEAPYVIAYKNLCYEGCVYQDDCGLLPCPQAAPKNGSACSSSNGTCYYEDCAGAGRSLATCVASAWQVESAACSSFTCKAPNTEAGRLTCAAGQVCVITTSTSFNVTPACENQTCGTRPMSTSCIEGLTGNCSPKYQLGGVVVSCAMPVP
jgi:hypothetical protein